MNQNQFEALIFIRSNYWYQIFTLGNAMAFAGLPNAKDRGDLIAYIKEASKWVMIEWLIASTPSWFHFVCLIYLAFYALPW